MEIQCPTSGSYVLVSGSGSGSGGGTICIRGVTTDQDNGDTGSGYPTVVRVRILSGHVPPPPLPPPEPKEPGDVDVAPIDQEWCARDVPVPGSSPVGVPLTAVAWLQTGGQWLLPHSVPFYAGGPDPINCCAACGPAPRTAPPADAFASWPPPPPPLPPL